MSKLPIPLPPGTFINVSKAASIAGWSEDTMRRRAVERGLGRQIGGKNKPLRISYPGLMAFLAGDEEALGRMRLGDFESDNVRRYLSGRLAAGARE